MIRIAIVDHSAESRSDIIGRLNTFLSDAGGSLLLLPRISLKPLCPQELRFNAAADLLIVGPELISRDLSQIAKIKKMLPRTPVVAWLNQQQSTLSTIEQVARQGADDVLTHDATADYFFRRLLMLVRKASHQSNGKLIVVDGGKGGVGVTTLTAALAEMMVGCGKKVAVVDLDFETQDLSRFLQARPFVNENLALLLGDERPVSEETVSQCLNPVWQDDNSLRCMSPVPETDDLYDPRSSFPKTFLSVLEILDHANDFVIVDCGCVRSSLQRLFYRVADKLLFLVNDDPASLYASVDKLTKARALLAAGAQLTVLQNSVGLSGLGNRLLRREFSRVAKLKDSDWAPEAISFCRVGQRWPGSGASFYSQAKSQTSKQLEKLAIAMNLIEAEESPGMFSEIFKKFRKVQPKEDASIKELPGYEVQKDSQQKLLGMDPNSKEEKDNLPVVLKDEMEFDSIITKPKRLMSREDQILSAKIS